MMKFLIVSAALLASPALAQQPTQCDLLAGHPEDPDKVGPGAASVPDKKAAIAACEKDLAADPGNRRLRYQLGRVLFYDGQTEKSVGHLEAAAAAGSSQTQFVLGYITDEGLNGVKKDPCKVEDLWVRAARAGRFAAQVSYPHHVMTGRFAGCKQQASDEEATQFLEQAKKSARGFGYYGELLVSTLTRDFAAYRAGKK